MSWKIIHLFFCLKLARSGAFLLTLKLNGLLTFLVYKSWEFHCEHQHVRFAISMFVFVWTQHFVTKVCHNLNSTSSIFLWFMCTCFVFHCVNRIVTVFQSAYLHYSSRRNKLLCFDAVSWLPNCGRFFSENPKFFRKSSLPWSTQWNKRSKLRSTL